MLNKLKRSLQKDQTEGLKQDILKISNEVMDIFFKHDCSVAMAKDVLQTVHNHLDHNLLNQKISGILRKE